MEETPVHALDYINVLRRRKWWLIVPIAASVVAGVLLVYFLPKEYRSTATLGVSQPSVSPNLVAQASPLDNQDRIRALEQDLVSAPILTELVKEEGIDGGVLTETRAAELRKAIKFGVPDQVVPTNEIRRLDTFLVSVGDRDPVQAQRLTNRLVNIFVNANAKVRTSRAQDTSAFIALELKDSQARLATLEAELRRAKESHIGQLPEQMQANLESLSGFRQQQETTASTLRTEQDHLQWIMRSKESMEQGSANAIVPLRGGGVADVQNAETRVLALEKELEDANAKWTPKHPEVQRLEGELAAARAAAAADKKRPVADRVAQLTADPVYRGLIAEQATSESRIRELKRAEEDARRQIAVYQSRVEGAPLVEQQLAAVIREYELEKTQYENLNNRLRAAEIAENVEMSGEGQQFTILYPASLPQAPIKPVPLQVMLISIMAGVCLGGASAFGREYLDRSVHDARDIRDEFDLPVLGEVNRIGV
jgi:succinoglycan biosynthesis transport protein ExoP